MSIQIDRAPAAAPLLSLSAVEVGPEVPPIDDGLQHPATDVPRKPALSPSRASDFKTCPLLYRYRAIDRIPEPPSKPAVRGTLIHATLEDLFTRPAAERTLASAIDRLAPLWEQLLASRPELVDLVAEEDLGEWFDAAETLLHTYFGLEDPARLEPTACELRVEVDLPDGVPLRGFIDRLDVSADGRVRVVDYKTGRSPGENYTTDVLFQLKFYALMLFRLRGVVPARLRLVYLGDNQLLEYAPDSDELVAFERQVVALWRAIERATQTRNFPARTSRLCDWCSFQALCPEFGGTAPPFPEPVAVAEGAGEGAIADAEPEPTATSR